MDFQVGDKVRTKKVHSCGSKEWILERVGVDFKIRILGSCKMITMTREKALKAITKKEI